MRRVQVESSNGARQCKTKLTKKIRRIRLLLKSLSYSKQVCMASGNVLQCSKRRSRRSWCSCRLISKACVCMRVHTCVCTCTENTTTTHSTPTEGWRTHASISYNLFCKDFSSCSKDPLFILAGVFYMCVCSHAPTGHGHEVEPSSRRDALDTGTSPGSVSMRKRAKLQLADGEDGAKAAAAAPAAEGNARGSAAFPAFMTMPSAIVGGGGGGGGGGNKTPPTQSHVDVLAGIFNPSPVSASASAPSVDGDKVNEAVGGVLHHFDTRINDTKARLSDHMDEDLLVRKLPLKACLFFLFLFFLLVSCFFSSFLFFGMYSRHGGRLLVFTLY